MSANYNYGGFQLKRNDNDRRKHWGGQRRSSEGGHVEALQKDLARLGTFIWRTDGDFGPKTELALKMFQWNAKTISKRIMSGAIAQDAPVYTGAVSGGVDIATKTELQRWLSRSFIATGDLVRISQSSFDSIELGSGFRKIPHPSIGAHDLVVSSDLVDYLKLADEKAKELSLTLVINQAMRVNGAPVSGAVVTPATQSQHLIGHAIDCNIVDGDNWNSSKTFEDGKETANAKAFIKALKLEGMRWGGDFTQRDTPHFDKMMLASGPGYNFKYFFNQRTVSEKQIVPLTTW